jgi:DNA-binding NarL/FixJ family response regulator
MRLTSSVVSQTPIARSIELCALAPDLAIVYLWLTEMSEYKLIGLLKRLNPTAKVIATSAEFQRERAILAGKEVFIVRDDLIDDLIPVDRIGLLVPTIGRNSAVFEGAASGHCRG